MKPNELRIGNLVIQNEFHGYVYSIESPLPRKEKRFSDKAIITLFDNGLTTVPIDEIEPIPLTEEWLLKFGFDKYEFDHKENQYRHKERLIVLRDDKFVDYGSSVVLEHIHQLQNLYFALTGSELTLKNK